MKNEHTPSPWIARIDNYGIDVVTDNDKSFGIVCFGTHSQLADAEYPLKEAEANAKLIAAAPELLEALQEILLVAKTFELLPRKWIEPLEKGELAIKKATEYITK